MKYLTNSDFCQAYAALYPEIKYPAIKADKLWQENPFHPSLHFKKIGNKLWSVRLTENYRALALKKEEDY